MTICFNSRLDTFMFRGLPYLAEWLYLVVNRYNIQPCYSHSVSVFGEGGGRVEEGTHTLIVVWFVYRCLDVFLDENITCQSPHDAAYVAPKHRADCGE